MRGDRERAGGVLAFTRPVAGVGSQWLRNGQRL